jgi:hypothetical protein
MEDDVRVEDARVRLLYDDDRPRLRRPINPTVLKLRRPTFLVLPLVFVLTSCAVGYGAASVVSPLVLNAAPLAVAAVLAVFTAAVLGLTLMLGSREEKSFALLLPNALSVGHALLMLVATAVLLVPGLLSGEVASQALAALPGPRLDDAVLMLAKAYVLAFVLVTLASGASVVLFRLLALRRVVADAA